MDINVVFTCYLIIQLPHHLPGQICHQNCILWQYLASSVENNYMVSECSFKWSLAKPRLARSANGLPNPEMPREQATYNETQAEGRRETHDQKLANVHLSRWKKETLKGRQRQRSAFISVSSRCHIESTFSTVGDRSATTLAQSRCCIRCVFELLLLLLPLGWC